MNKEIVRTLTKIEGRDGVDCTDEIEVLASNLGLRTTPAIDALKFACAGVILLDQKQEDYGSRNISDFGSFGVLVRMNDKLQRLRNLLAAPGVLAGSKVANFESLQDTAKDLTNYGLILQLLLAGEWPKN